MVAPRGFGIIVPARYASTRLPAKALRDLCGKPLTVRVWENALRVGADFVLVATDDERIASVVRAEGGQVVMTSPSHPTGTDRLAEVVQLRGLSPETVVVNVQGDEPLLEPELVRGVAEALLARPRAGIATLATPIRGAPELFDPNVVKVVLDAEGYAGTFSRAPLPWVRGVFVPGEVPQELPADVPFLRHVGLYAYRAATLLTVAAAPQVPHERAESLEQLRACHLGIPIHVTVVAEPPGHGVDTEEDLRKVQAIFAARQREP